MVLRLASRQDYLRNFENGVLVTTAGRHGLVVAEVQAIPALRSTRLETRRKQRSRHGYREAIRIGGQHPWCDRALQIAADRAGAIKARLEFPASAESRLTQLAPNEIGGWLLFHRK